jgi:outer membrane protein OmpA-like peptidoglycan-associated protein
MQILIKQLKFWRICNYNGYITWRYFYDHLKSNELTVRVAMKHPFKKFTVDRGRAYRVCAVCLVYLLLVGCAVMPGGSVNTYPADYRTTVQASNDTLEELKIPVTETIADGLKTIFKAQRADGTPVVVKVVRIDRNSTEVSVRTGSVGFGDQRAAIQINEFINERLDPSIAASSRLGFTEENLDNKTNQKAAAAPAAGAGDQAWNRSPQKVAEMLHDSIFIIYFDTDSNELSDEAKGKLDRVVEIMRNNPAASATLNGYTDSYGAKSYNETIAGVRAIMVKSYLVDNGISSERLKTFGHGAQKFIGSNKTREGRRMNRRVEIEMIGVKQQ